MRIRQSLKTLLLRFFRSKVGHREGGFSSTELAKRTNTLDLSELRNELKKLALDGIVLIVGKTRATRYLQGPRLWDGVRPAPVTVEIVEEVPATAPTTALALSERRLDLAGYSPDLTLPVMRALGVSPGITKSQLRPLRRALMAQHHPDHGGDIDLWSSMMEAFEVLTVMMALG